ncbi:MAG: hypothetical protein Q8S18_09345 [Bacteroidales bacterium]|nr:hypothetical protein [Bacteroidales bacterium]
MLPLFDSLLGLSWALWVVISFVVLTGAIALLFLIHRRNNKLKFIELEQKIYDHSDVVHKQLEYKIFRLQKLIEELPVGVHIPASLQSQEPEISRETKEQADFRSVPGLEAVEQELAELKQQLNQLTHQNEVFKQGIYLLINELGNRLNASDSHLNRFINLLDELAHEHGMDLFDVVESETEIKQQYSEPLLTIVPPENIADHPETPSGVAEQEEEQVPVSTPLEATRDTIPDTEDIVDNELIPEVIETEESEKEEVQLTQTTDFSEQEDLNVVTETNALIEDSDLPVNEFSFQPETEEMARKDESLTREDDLSKEGVEETIEMVETGSETVFHGAEMEDFRIDPEIGAFHSGVHHDEELDTIEPQPETGIEARESYHNIQTDPSGAGFDQENEENAGQLPIEEVKADVVFSLPVSGKMYFSAPEPGGFFTSQSMSAEPTNRSVFVATIDPAAAGMASLSILTNNAELIAETIANADVWLRPVCDIQSLKGTGTRLTQLQKGVLQYAEGKWTIRDDARVKLLLF